MLIKIDVVFYKLGFKKAHVERNTSYIIVPGRSSLNWDVKESSCYSIGWGLFLW